MTAGVSRWPRARRAGAAAVAIAAAVHLTALLVPAVNSTLYSATYPRWRHGVLIVADAGLAWLIARQSPLAPGACTLAVLYTCAGHGRVAWDTWHVAGRIASIDVLVVLGSLVLLVLVAADRSTAASASATSSPGGR
jgi:hypothetical protein